MKRHFTVTVKEAKTLAKALAKELKGGDVLALIGPLGSGKTTFVKALAKALKIKNSVSSPSFIIMQSFLGKLPKGNKVILNHLDLYRTKNFKEIAALGFTELLKDKNSITAIEWADKLKAHFPKKSYRISFKPLK